MTTDTFLATISRVLTERRAAYGPRHGGDAPMMRPACPKVHPALPR